ncbi:metallophosphoesterase [Pontibacter rugosus]|uniref:Metallophosphoesterase n=1 Tax=Pontibacter rugosus TaxID=1745966 RepID=A0ABW3SM90_9BACT
MAGAVLLDALILEKYFFDVKSFDIGRKSSGKKIKLALLTDLHFKQNLLPHHRKLATKLNQINPDLLLIAGDTLDSSGSMEPVKSFFSLLNQSIKKVSIPGNNDYKASAGIDTLEQVLQKYNCYFLVNESKAYTWLWPWC